MEGDTTTSFLRVVASEESRLCGECHRDKTAIRDTMHDLRRTAEDTENVHRERPALSGVCGACHTPHNGTSIRLWARREISSREDPVSNLCLGCHSDEGAAREKKIGPNTHPIGVPLRNVDILPREDGWLSKYIGTLKGPLAEPEPVELPLYDGKGRKVRNGKVACATCHDPHRWSPGSKGTGGAPPAVDPAVGDGSNSFLRIANDRDSNLCRNCHIEKRSVALTRHNLENFSPEEVNIAGNTVSDSGVCSACHVPHNGTGPRLWARETAGGDDSVQGMCRSCHSKGGPAEEKTVGGHSHPVGVPLRPAMESSILPLYGLDGRPVDRGGNVVCTTCHDPHQWDPEDINSVRGIEDEGDASDSFLRIRAADDAGLCTTCHEEKKWVVATEHDMRITVPDAENNRGQTVSESGVCGQCHTVHNPVLDVRLWAREPGPGQDMMERLCRSCHSDGRIAAGKQPVRFRHPQDVLVVSSDEFKRAEGKKVSFPLYEPDGRTTDAGYITCPTCHNPHRWRADRPAYGPGRNTEGNALNSFLRNRSESALCTDCHGMDGLFRYKYFHGTTSRKKKPPSMIER